TQRQLCSTQRGACDTQRKLRDTQRGARAHQRHFAKTLRGIRMSPYKRHGGARLAFIAAAFAASASLFGSERHNIILFIPEVLSAANVYDDATPALTRLRDDGVDFFESHSRFPSLDAPSSEIAADFNKDKLLRAATAAQYSAAFREDLDAKTVVKTLR